MSTLPSGYTELEYTYSSGSQYFNTGYIPNNSSTRPVWELTVQYDSESGNQDNGLITSSNRFHIGTYSNKVGVGVPGGNYDYSSTVSATAKQKVVLDCVNNNYKVYVDDELQFSKSMSISNNNTGISIYLFARNNNNSKTDCYCSCKIFSSRIYEYDTLVREYIPCKNSDEVAGMYETVNGVFYSSATSTAFIAGPEVEETPDTPSEDDDPTEVTTYPKEVTGTNHVLRSKITRILYDSTDATKLVFKDITVWPESEAGYDWSVNEHLPYIELEYIQNTSNAYINTGFKPNGNSRCVIDCQMVTSTDYGRIFGAGMYNNAVGWMIDFETGSSGTLHVKYFGTTSWNTYSSISGAITRRTYDLNKNIIYVDGTQVGSGTYTTSYSASYPMAIFTYINNSNSRGSDPSESFRGKVYSCQIYNNGTLVRDYIPVKMKSNSEIGLYDKVNEVFYKSPNGTVFTAGPEI